MIKERDYRPEVQAEDDHIIGRSGPQSSAPITEATLLEYDQLVEEVVADLETKEALAASPKPKQRVSPLAIYERDQARKAEFARIRSSELKASVKAAEKLAGAEKKREKATERQRQRRARRAALTIPTLVSFPKPSLMSLATEKGALLHWLAGDGPRQRQWRRHAGDIMRERTILLFWRASSGREPSYDEFAVVLTRVPATPVTRDAARRRYERLVILETDGPWKPTFRCAPIA